MEIPPEASTLVVIPTMLSDVQSAKDLVEAAPKAVKEAAPKEEAEKIKAQLEAAGAKVEVK